MSNPSGSAPASRPVGFPHDNASVAQRLGGEAFSVEARGFTFNGYRAMPSASANGIPTVVLVHGWPQFASCWEEIARTLLDQGFEVVAFDQRGYSPGARPGEVEDYTLEQLTGDIDEVTRALGIDKFHLVGHDWGGIIGWIYAAAHPERLRSYTSLASPHPVGQLQATAEDPGQYKKMSYIRGIQADPDASRDALFADDAALLRALYGGAVDGETVAAYVERFREPGIMDAVLKYYQALGKGQLPPNLTATVPTLYIWGDQDIAFSRSSADKSAEFVSGEYKFVDLSGASHWLPEERADEIAPEICAWIAVHEG